MALVEPHSEDETELVKFVPVEIVGRPGIVPNFCEGISCHGGEVLDLMLVTLKGLMNIKHAKDMVVLGAVIVGALAVKAIPSKRLRQVYFDLVILRAFPGGQGFDPDETSHPRRVDGNGCNVGSCGC